MSDVIALYERKIIGLIEARSILAHYFEGFREARDNDIDQKLREHAERIASEYREFREREGERLGI